MVTVPSGFQAAGFLLHHPVPTIQCPLIGMASVTHRAASSPDQPHHARWAASLTVTSSSLALQGSWSVYEKPNILFNKCHFELSLPVLVSVAFY